MHFRAVGCLHPVTSHELVKKKIEKKKKNMSFLQPIKSFIGLSNIQTDKVKNESKERERKIAPLSSFSLCSLPDKSRVANCCHLAAAQPERHTRSALKSSCTDASHLSVEDTIGTSGRLNSRSSAGRGTARPV